MDWFCRFSRIAALLLLGVGFSKVRALPVEDGDFPCTARAKAESYIRELNIEVESFGGLELCSPDHELKKLFNDLDLIENGEFRDRGDNFFIHDFVPGHSYFPWLVEQTRGIERGNDLPWATAYNSGGYFTMQDGWAKLSTAGRVGTLIHEARHTEGYYHVPCEQGPYQGSGLSACDSHVPAGGSHAVEMEYYARVSERGQNFHPVYQAMVRLMLIARSNFVFNDDPLSANEILMALTPVGLVRLGKDGPESMVMGWPDPDARLKRSSLGITLFAAPDRAWAVDWLTSRPAVTVKDEYSYFKMLNRGAPADQIDLEEIDIRDRRYLVALDSQGQSQSFQFANGDWGPQAMQPGLARFVTVAPDGRAGLFGVFDDFTFCELDPETTRCLATPAPWPRDAEKFIVYKGRLLRLGSDQKVYDSQGRLFTPLANFDVRDLATVPDYGVFP